MIIRENVSLKPFNSFGLDVKARRFVEIDSIEDLEYFSKYNSLPKDQLLILGGGSNILLTKDFEGTVLKVNLLKKEILSKDENSVVVSAGAGENWHEFVLWCINHNFGGVENLSLIPGNVGTAPMQNIGAYGVEIKDVFHSLKAIHIESGKIHSFTKEECEFGYRESVFKGKLKGQFIITEVNFKLTTKDHLLHTSYGAIKSELESKDVSNPGIKEISDAVISIRRSKLPDPKEIGNSGSFFKNPVISNKEFEKLKVNYPDAVGYPNGKEKTKVAAGWLIEKAGWKGYRNGDFGVHKRQALVLVNYGNAKGKDIKELSSLIQKSIKETFDIDLQAEVNIL